MFKKTILLILFFGIAFAHAQKDSIYAEVLVKSFTLDNDTVNLIRPKEIILRKIGCSEIVTLGQIKGLVVGMQLELVRSYLGKESLVISGKAFFVKFHDEWIMDTNITYSKAEFKIMPDESSIKPGGMGGGVTQFRMGSKEFTISYSERYYFFW